MYLADSSKTREYLISIRDHVSYTVHVVIIVITGSTVPDSRMSHMT